MIYKTKNCEIENIKAEQSEEGFYISGYANTKGKADSYGDIPTSLDGKPVYDLARFKRNPVALIDHKNSIGNIFGAFLIGPEATREDEKGLYIKLRLMDNPQTEEAKHAVEAYKSGFARAFSIGGQWKFEDPKNAKHLTSAIIHEISGVAIGADERALSEISRPKSIEDAKNHRLAVLEFMISEYRKTPSVQILSYIKKIKGVH